MQQYGGHSKAVIFPVESLEQQQQLADKQREQQKYNTYFSTSKFQIKI